MKPLFVTTPIYYVNDRPHIGHAYSTIAADLLCRYGKLRGRRGRLLSGTDEHGQKIERRAKEESLSPQEFVDRMAPRFRDLCQTLHCAPDDFIRTTELRHKQQVQALWQRMVDAGDIYLGAYEGWYSVSEETYYTEKELLPGNLSPINKKPVELVKEPSYFFRLSRFTQPLLDFYAQHPHFVRPEGRFNEVKRFVEEGLRDLSVSRTTFRWGVPVPNHPEHVVYVWLDALANYLSALGGPATDGRAPLYEAFWPPQGEAVHIVGKDILRFHAIFWPAFLMSAGIEPPTQVWAHGWLTVDGEKMSKSAGNFTAPEPLCDALGADTLRYYLMRDVAFGQDGDFSHTALLARYQGDLGNGLGNLLNRVVASIVPKYCDGRVPQIDLQQLDPVDSALIETAQRCAAAALAHLDEVAPQRALDAIWELVSATNKYVDQTAPWALGKNGEQPRLDQVTYHVLEALRWLSVMLWPFMPQKSQELRHQLGLPALLPVQRLDLWPSVWGGLVGGTQLRPGAPLFPRFDKPQEEALLERFGVRSTHSPGSTASAPHRPIQQQESSMSTPTVVSSIPATPPTSGGAAAADANGGGVDGRIDFEDFAKVELRLGVVRQAERVPKSDKLLKLQVDLGERDASGKAELRQILAGIGVQYEPATLIDRQILVVANLKPRKLMGLESRGMVLAVHDEQGLSLLAADRRLPPGTKAS